MSFQINLGSGISEDVDYAGRVWFVFSVSFTFYNKSQSTWVVEGNTAALNIAVFWVNFPFKRGLVFTFPTVWNAAFYSRLHRHSSAAGLGDLKAVCEVCPSWLQNGKVGLLIDCSRCLSSSVRREGRQSEVKHEPVHVRTLVLLLSCVVEFFFFSAWKQSWCCGQLPSFDSCDPKHCRKRTLATRELVQNHLPNCVELKNLGKATN